MNKFSTIKLVNKVVTYDELGIPRSENNEREVFATINSISAAEFFKAGETGLKAEIMFSLWNYEYENEEEVVYNNQSYSVYRKYSNGEGRVELYCQKKVSNEQRS